jgi:hypothetical protein
MLTLQLLTDGRLPVIYGALCRQHPFLPEYLVPIAYVQMGLN